MMKFRDNISCNILLYFFAHPYKQFSTLHNNMVYLELIQFNVTLILKNPLMPYQMCLVMHQVHLIAVSVGINKL